MKYLALLLLLIPSFAFAAGLELVGAVSGTNVAALTFPAVNSAQCESYQIRASITNSSQFEGPQPLVQATTDGATWREANFYETTISGNWANDVGQVTNYSPGGISIYVPFKPAAFGNPDTPASLTHGGLAGPVGIVLSYDWNDATGTGMATVLDIQRTNNSGKTKISGLVNFGPGPAAHVVQGNFYAGFDQIKGFRLIYGPNGNGQYVEQISGRASLWCYSEATTGLSHSQPYTLTADGSNNTNQTWRQVAAPGMWGGFAGTSLRLTLQASGTSSLTVAKCYRGEKAASGNPYDTVSMVPVTFDGGNPGTGTIPANGLKVSDVITAPTDPAKSYVTSCYVSTGAMKFGGSNANVQAYVLGGDQASATVAPAGGSAMTAGGSYGVQKLEW